ncbi:MAG: hypothetical protein HGA31_01425 [Candidatus Moranbacteria bacterium]|nr:hypothetical protein [Candidatus Moranbacteria bacterium]
MGELTVHVGFVRTSTKGAFSEKKKDTVAAVVQSLRRWFDGKNGFDTESLFPKRIGLKDPFGYAVTCDGRECFRLSFDGEEPFRIREEDGCFEAKFRIDGVLPEQPELRETALENLFGFLSFGRRSTNPRFYFSELRVNGIFIRVPDRLDASIDQVRVLFMEAALKE